MFNFDRVIDRSGTDSVKWDGRADYFGRADLIPLWVADMDFAAPPAVVEALQARAAHPLYGYTCYPDALYQTLIDWLAARHGWQVERDWLIAAPGVVPTLSAAILAFTELGGGVIVQPPVYGPFTSCVQEAGRTPVLNPLKHECGRYTIDLAHLESCAAAGARLLLFCSPHNPVGRVWQPGELAGVVEIARRYDLLILSDEIHADLLYPGVRHTPLATLAPERVITALAPSKTFNIPGLGLSAIIAPEKRHRAALEAVLRQWAVSPANPFSIAGWVAAYREGAPWLDELMPYIAETQRQVAEFLQKNLPQIRVTPPEATYLLWLDCRDMGLTDEALKQFCVRRAGVGMNPGTVFGTGGSGFMRLNIGAPRARIMQALQQLATAWNERGR